MLGVNGSSTNSRRNFNSDTDLIRTLDENEFAEAAVGGTNNPNNTCYFRTLKNDDGTLIFKNREGRGAMQTWCSHFSPEKTHKQEFKLCPPHQMHHSTVLKMFRVVFPQEPHTLCSCLSASWREVRHLRPVELPDNSASFIPSQSNAYTLFIPRKDNDGNGPATAYAGNRLVPPNEYSVTVNQSTGSLRVEIGSNDNIRDTGSQEIYGVINVTVFRDSIPNDHTHNIRTLSLNNNVMSAFDQTRSISGVTLAVTNLDAESLYPNLFGRTDYIATGITYEVSNRGAGPNQPVFELDHAHVYDITKIEDIDGNEVTDRFELLDGQKPDAFYHSSIRLISGATLSRSGTDDFALGSVSYRYFEHAGVDKPITVDSYPSTIDIESIPRFTDPESGIDFSLANAVDFRPVELNTSSRRNQGSTHGFLNVGSLPEPPV